MSALDFMLLVLATLQSRTAAFGALITPATNSPRTAASICFVGGYTPCCRRPLSSVRPPARSSFERRANTIMGANEEMKQFYTASEVMYTRACKGKEGYCFYLNRYHTRLFRFDGSIPFLSLIPQTSSHYSTVGGSVFPNTRRWCRSVSLCPFQYYFVSTSCHV